MTFESSERLSTLEVDLTDCGQSGEMLPPPQACQRPKYHIHPTINGAVWACAAERASQRPVD